MKFGVGQPVRRYEDLRLITGRGRYTDDVVLPRMSHAFVLRAPVAHATIKRIDAAAARRMPGVLFVGTGEDVRADGLGDVPCTVPLVSRDGKPRHDTPRPVLALGKVRHVGQPVALVVAETLAQARDAAEAIAVDYETLPAVTDAKDAIAPGAPLLFDHIPNNIVFDWDNDMGDAKATEARSPRRRAPSASTSSTTASWSIRWSRATPSAITMRKAAARRSTPRRKVRISCAIRSPRSCSNCRRTSCA
jgi:aerobic carbon-monoxide dehydrogenase large subunit